MNPPAVSMTWPQYLRGECSFTGSMHLTRREADLLAVLMLRRGQIVPRAEIFDFLYGDDEDGGPLTGWHLIARFVCDLRKKIPGIAIVSHMGRGLEMVQ